MLKYTKKYVGFEVAKAVTTMAYTVFCEVSPSAVLENLRHCRWNVLPRRVNQGSRVPAICFVFISTMEIKAINTSETLANYQTTGVTSSCHTTALNLGATRQDATQRNAAAPYRTH
jgi:hypothetical protein